MNITKKVETSRISEKEYRGIRSRLSYSSIKLFDTDRKSFYKQMVLGELPTEKKSIALVLGDLCHLLLSLPESFDEKFVIAGTQRPSGQMGDFTDALVARALKTIDENGVQQDKFSVLFSDAFNSIKFDYEGNEIAFKKKEMSWALEKFQDKEPEMYYKECMESIGRTVVSTATIESAERIVEKIKAHPYTSGIANLETSDEVEVFNELPILFELEGVGYKSMVDKLVVSHTDKVIKTYDWKTTFDVDKPQFAYLKYGYYLQAAMYRDAVRMWAKENDLSDYKIEPMVFVFCDTTGFQASIKLLLTDDDVNRACRGFMYRGIRSKGLRELQADIAWCLSTGDWGNSEQLDKTNGYVDLGLRYGTL